MSEFYVMTVFPFCQVESDFSRTRLGYYSDGHHDPDAFLAEIKRLYGERPIEGVVHRYMNVKDVGEIPITWVQHPDPLLNR